MTHPAPILIAGPTAAGKSALALQLAHRFDGVIVNADALQVYGCWHLLTARPSAAEEAEAPHRLYGHIGKYAQYSVGHWLRDVGALLQSETRRPIIIGGTGLYFMALTEGLAEIPDIPSELRERANDRDFKDLSTDLLREDAATAARIDMANPTRVRRAWEVLRATGQGLAAWHDQTPPPLIDPAAAVPVLLEADRDWLADRIDRRFDAMMASGAQDEVAAYISDGWDPGLPSAQAIGAKDLVAHLRGEVSLEAAMDAAKAQTRQYAKRQRTWFRRRMSDWLSVNPRAPEAAIHEIATAAT